MIGSKVELLDFYRGGDEIEPYERLLGDAMRGDPTLFAHPNLKRFITFDRLTQQYILR